MEAVVRGHARILQIVLDTGASKDLDSIVTRDEGDLLEVGFISRVCMVLKMWVSTSRTGSRFST